MAAHFPFIGFQNYRVNQEAARARAYLEAHVNQMTSYYDLAITSYALAKSGSSLGAVAFSKLDSFATMKGNGVYQSSDTGSISF